jgi:hypothetical protein
LWWAVTLAGAVGLFFGYLRMSRTQASNSDGASNALQAWDILHGNVLLRGWTLSDVSFYTTEIPQYALVELFYGLRGDVIHVAAAMTYTLLVVAAAILAKGRATGVAGLVRAAIAVAILLVPGTETGYLTLLNSPDHTGTGVPVLVTWIVLDRALTRPDGSYRSDPPRWLPYLITVLLAWGAIGDPLVAVTAALPLIVVCALRLVRARRLGGVEARLLAAGLGGILLARAALFAVRLAGGFAMHGVPVGLAGFGRLGRNAWIAVVGLAVNFGLFPADLHNPGAYAIAVIHLVGLLAVLAAVGLVAWRAVRGRWDDDLIAPVLAFGMLANVGAFILSTIPFDKLSARQIVAVLPLGAALAGRLYGPRLAASLRTARRYLPAMGAALLALCVAFGVQAATARPVPAANQDIAQWLDDHNYRYGIGGYWDANVITLVTGGRVRVVPLTGAAADRGSVLAYRWESRADWFDPARHDARFIVIDKMDAAYGTVDIAVRQFGPPVARKNFGRFAVLLYDHNLLVGLPALCAGGHEAAAMSDCPP